MRATARIGAALVMSGVLIATMTACGIGMQDAAQPLPSNALPAPLRIPTPAASIAPSVTPTPGDSPSVLATPSRLRLWFVQDDGLAAVESGLPVGSPPDLILQSLAIGPTAAEGDQGLRTVARDPLTGQALVTVRAAGADPTPSVSSPAAPTDTPSEMVPDTVSSVTVTLGAAFSALPPSEQVLLLGQVVMSLASAGERSVAFTDDAGSPVAVPLPDGRLLDVPATARDYASLIVRP